MKQVTLLFLFFCFYLIPVHAQLRTYHNPVIPEDMADPCIIRIDDKYYAAGTSSEWAPFYPMYVSTDLINWTQTGHIFDTQPEWTLSSFWAPELFYHKNKLYAYYTARNKEGVSYIGVATTDDPQKPFTDHGQMLAWGTEAIDAFILEDNGELYISWKAYGLDKRPIELLGCRLSKDGLKLDGEPFSLLVDDENIGMEGQHWIKLGDYYYILYSIGGCCGPGSDYQVYCARSKNLQGPYEKYAGNPILHGDGLGVLSCGHGTVTTTPDGRMYYLYHAYLTNEGFYGGRQVMLQELYKGNDNWIHFKDGNTVQLIQPMPFENTKQKPVNNFRDNFNADKLSVKWTWNYPYSTINTKVGNGELILSGVPKDNNNGTALCIRPTSPYYTYQTKVTNSNNSLKGLTMYGDVQNYLAFGAMDNKLVVKAIKDGEEQLLFTDILPTELPYLKIQVNKGTKCNFFWSEDGKQWQKVQLSSTMNMSYLVRWDRVARPGLIHAGAENEPARFNHFYYMNE
ncbi:family 43 glycosylhydrolase [Bacteroides sp. 519]|uniref:family 43 glycosylhydrolase n=1 Tax=Bacteroides sp. 519 TaxID=2302937 RepID=UPI0013D56D28|nr:family 43 glycosylhydrolase [Bacteroides sp. 519]NDV57190.1 beta-xylosidase [Bacteroides sp. 519]